MRRVVRVFHPGVLPSMPTVETSALWLGVTYLAWDLGTLQSLWLSGALSCFWLARLLWAIYRATHEEFVVPMTMGVQEIEDDNPPEGG